jgi:hypothetical protein
LRRDFLVDSPGSVVANDATADPGGIGAEGYADFRIRKYSFTMGDGI